MPDLCQSDMLTPRQEYARLLEARRAEEARLIRRYHLIARMRSIVLGAIVLVAWLAEKERTVVLCSLLAAPSLLFEMLVRKRNRLSKALWRAGRAAEFYEARLARVEDRWYGRGEPGTHYLDENHPCALDLDLFGHGCLFPLLCLPSTRWGRDTLASWLRGPATVEEVNARQVAVAELRDQLSLREELAVLSSEMPAENDLAALAAWGQAEEVSVSGAWRRIALVLTVLCLVTFAGWSCLGMGPLPFLGVLVLERGFAWFMRGRVRGTLGAVEQRMRGLRALAALLARLEHGRYTSWRLCQLHMTFGSPSRPASEYVRRLRRLLGLAPLAYVFMCRTPLAFALGDWRRNCGPALSHWLRALGEHEALSALAAHAFENPGDPFPDIVSDGPCFEAEELGHPLLPRDRCVRNDVRLNGELRVLIVSGSNMAGKSTFLRTVGVNAVLALAGAPVRARRLRISPLIVGATLRIQDSLQAGRSRFFAEVLRVRQLLDLARQRPPLLFLLDELFQGTNSQDRRIGAEAVVGILIDSGAIGLITTHDLALTDIVERLSSRALNVHFEDRFENGVLTFDYRLRPGIVQSSNGLVLMRAVGIEV